MYRFLINFGCEEFAIEINNGDQLVSDLIEMVVDKLIPKNSTIKPECQLDVNSVPFDSDARIASVFGEDENATFPTLRLSLTEDSYQECLKRLSTSDDLILAVDLDDIVLWDCMPYDDGKIRDILSVVLPRVNPTYQEWLLVELENWSDGPIEVSLVFSSILEYLEKSEL
ncbi:hypothetical protein BDV30DRAFT_245641 [Aspergillus minisclerotigenes]|uniref:Uncharacterized protein n=1 Tax=Aspergillus minisclerotigenes TaxID=656917 RepID=A0A5N6IQU3_9EURO|nr:hypothetical protein BDV30DRAFT_245641 [Aspergillus minisclerotigenes]